MQWVCSVLAVVVVASGYTAAQVTIEMQRTRVLTLLGCVSCALLAVEPTVHASCVLCVAGLNQSH